MIEILGMRRIQRIHGPHATDRYILFTLIIYFSLLCILIIWQFFISSRMKRRNVVQLFLNTRNNLKNKRKMLPPSWVIFFQGVLDLTLLVVKELFMPLPRLVIYAIMICLCIYQFFGQLISILVKVKHFYFSIRIIW